jgi:ribonuclease HI
VSNVSLFKVYTDGAARGNPGPSASGFMVFQGTKKIHGDFTYNGESTNNHAEYKAVMNALEWCAANIPSDSVIEFYSDSELVVKQINGIYKTRSKELMGMKKAVIELVRKIGRVSFHNLPRENLNISQVDRMLNKLLDQQAHITNINLF